MPQYVSKVIYGNQTLIDLTGDTINASRILSGYTAHDSSGTPVVGSCSYDAYTGDANATADDILYGKTAYKNGSKLTGTMTNVGKQTSYMVSRDSAVSITAGYHDGSGTVALATSDRSALISNNIRQGITILGVVGTMTGSEDVKATALVATPYTSTASYLPTDLGDYNYFSQVTVSAIAYSTTSNEAGGLTATIGTVAPA